MMEIIMDLLRNIWYRISPPEISLLIPFGAPKKSDRRVILKWITKYWHNAIPGAEIVMGYDRGYPFSKTTAVNNAARKAHGKYFVILDADAYFDKSLILESVRRIKAAESHGRVLWFIPYRYLYRLTANITQTILASNPKNPYQVPIPPPPIDIEHIHRPNYGHHYAAMVMVMSRVAFYTVGGMDERFRGWGSEDVCFMHAVDTLYGRHRTLDKTIFHLHHERIGTGWDNTKWANQENTQPNHRLAMRYHRARRDKTIMRELVNGGLDKSSLSC